jgi:hypothetical protein
MQMTSYDGGAFREEFSGDLSVEMRGSSNPRPPSGDEVLQVDFKDGRTVGFEKFLKEFLIQGGGGSFSYRGRLAGRAIRADGSLFGADHSNGVVYHVSHGNTMQPKLSFRRSRHPTSQSNWWIRRRMQPWTSPTPSRAGRPYRSRMLQMVTTRRRSSKSPESLKAL